jgi:hypothetical protein
MTKPLNRYSSEITQPKSQGASQAMLYATGLQEPDMAKPQVGIASMWFEGNPCNMHLLQLADKVKEGVSGTGLVGLRFNWIARRTIHLSAGSYQMLVKPSTSSLSANTSSVRAPLCHRQVRGFKTRLHKLSLTRNAMSEVVPKGHQWSSGRVQLTGTVS